MPQIPNLRPQGITTRIGGASISTGGSATGQALAGLGGQVAQLGQQLLTKRVELQTQNFVNKSTEEMNKKRQDWEQQNSAQFDPLTGKMNDGSNRDYAKALEEFENEQLELVREQAPHSKAFEAFKRQDSNTRMRSLLKADQQQYQTMISARQDLDRKQVEGFRRELVTFEGDSLGRAQEMIEAVVKSRAEGVGTVYDKGTAQIAVAQASEGIAEMAMENMLDRGQTQRVLVELRDFASSSPEIMDEIEGEMLKSLEASLPSNLSMDNVTQGQDGYSRVQLDGESLVFEPGTGEWVPESEWQGPLSAEGKKSLEQFLSPEKKLKLYRKALGQIKEKSAESKSNVARRHRDIIAGVTSRVADGKIDVDTALGENAVREHIGTIRRTYDTETGDAMISEVLTSIVSGEVSREMGTMPVNDAIELINEVPERVLELAIDKGLIPPSRAEDEYFMQSMMESAQGRLAQTFAKMDQQRRKDPAGFFTENDSRFSRLSSKKDQGPNEWSEYQEALSAKQDMLGIPLSDRKYLPLAEMEFHASQLRDNLQKPTQESLALATDWVSQKKQVWGDKFPDIVNQMKNMGVEPEVIMAASMLNETKNTRIVNKVWENSINLPANMEKLKGTEITNKGINASVTGVLGDLQDSIALSAMADTDITSTYQGFSNMVKGEIAARALRLSATSDSQLKKIAEEVKKEFIDDHWSKVNTGNSSFLLSNEVLDKHQTTPRAMGAAMSTLLEPKRLMQEVDWEKSDPYLTSKLGDLSGSARSNAIERLVAGGALGNIVTVPSTGGVTLAMVMNDGRKVVLQPKEGRKTSFSFEEVLQSPEVNKEISSKLRSKKMAERDVAVRENRRTVSERLSRLRRDSL